MLQFSVGTGGAAPTDPVWVKALIAAIGPLITVVLGSALIGLGGKWLLDRKQRKDADLRFREQLAAEMSIVASTFYFELVRYRRDRAADGTAGDGPSWKRALSGLLRDAAEDTGRITGINGNYAIFRIAADSLENRLGVYFADDLARLHWHAVKDLLAVIFFSETGGLNATTLDANARNEKDHHSGLSQTELLDGEKLVVTYQDNLRSAVRAVMFSPRFAGPRKRRWTALFASDLKAPSQELSRVEPDDAGNGA